MKSIVNVFVAIALVFGINSCGAQHPTEINVSVDKLKEITDNLPENTVILDVRTPNEVKDGMVPHAVNMDYSRKEFEAQVQALDKTKTYYIYCKAGGRSAGAVEYMQNLGFTNVHNVEGGYDAWLDAGYNN